MHLPWHSGNRLPCAHHLNSQDRQRLANIVMQLARNTGPLVLLRRREALRHLVPRRFRRLPCRLGRAQIRQVLYDCQDCSPIAVR